MSIWTSQYIFYGIKVSYEDYRKIEEKLEAQGIDAYSTLSARENELGIGWLVDGMNGGFALIGKIIMQGEDTGAQEKLLVAEQGIAEIPLLGINEERGIWWLIHEQMPDLDRPCQYYVVTMYS